MRLDRASPVGDVYVRISRCALWRILKRFNVPSLYMRSYPRAGVARQPVASREEDIMLNLQTRTARAVAGLAACALVVAIGFGGNDHVSLAGTTP